MKMAYKEIAHEPKSSSSNMQKNHLIKQKSAHQNTEQFLGRPPIIFKMIAKGILCLQKTASLIGKPQHVITKGWSCWASTQPRMGPDFQEASPFLRHINKWLKRSQLSAVAGFQCRNRATLQSRWQARNNDKKISYHHICMALRKLPHASLFLPSVWPYKHSW